MGKKIYECETYFELKDSIYEKINYWDNSKENRAIENAEYWRGVLRGVEEFINMIKRNKNHKINILE